MSAHPLLRLGRVLAWLVVTSAACLVLAGGGARASELDQVLEEGNRAYADGRFGDALARYQRLVDHGVRDPGVLLNAGNALYRLGRLAEARLSWERALRRAPGDPDVEENLALAVKGLGLEPLGPPSWPERAFEAVLGALGAGGWVVVALGAWLALNAAIAWGWVSGRGRVARLTTVAVSGLALSCAAPIAWAFQARIARPEAVVVGGSASALSGPSPSATSLFEVPLGEKVGVEGEGGGWTHVSLPNGWHGWVPSSALARIDR